MTSPHLSEQALQEAAETVSLLPAGQAAHLHGCLLCQGRVDTYQQLFKTAAQLPPSAFSFDLTASVMAQLPVPKPAFPWVLSGVTALVLGIIGLFLTLFGGLLLQAFQGLFTQLGAGLAVVAGGVIAWQGLELLVQHRRQMSLLTFS